MASIPTLDPTTTGADVSLPLLGGCVMSPLVQVHWGPVGVHHITVARGHRTEHVVTYEGLMHDGRWSCVSCLYDANLHRPMTRQTMDQLHATALPTATFERLVASEEDAWRADSPLPDDDALDLWPDDMKVER